MLNLGKKLSLLLLTALMMTTNGWCNTLSKTENDTIVSVTHSQIKQINVFLLEHDKLLQENSLLTKEISLQKDFSDNCLKELQYKEQRLLALNNSLKDANTKYLVLEKKYNQKSKSFLKWKVGSFTVAAGVLGFLLLR